MNTNVVVKRGNGKKINENNEFVKDVVELKRANALSDNKAFEELLESISTKYADCVYLTEGELANQIRLCLEAASASNYDDETCRFLAEGILRTIHENFVDRVAKIVKLAGSRINEEAADKYAEFKAIAESFYKKLDESKTLEMQAFVDVYEALRQVHQLAKEENNEIVAEEAAAQLDSLLPIIKGEAELSADVLGEAAETLYDIVESTMPEEWKVSDPVVSADGQHPDLAKKGKTSQSPAEMQGTASDASELENDGWSNLGGEGVYPELDNPYVPKAGEYKIANEKSVDSDSGQLAHWGDADTWPNLQNPYSKASVTPKSVKE
jgi:BMFP domain-containing protein YqiC